MVWKVQGNWDAFLLAQEIWWKRVCSFHGMESLGKVG